MSSILQDIQYRFKNANIVEKLIYINIAVFIAALLINSIAHLFNYTGENFVFEWFAMRANINEFITKPWTILSYGFLHGDFVHILFNLIFLFYIGNLFLDYFTQKKLLSFYVYGTLFGGLLYLISYNYFPALKPYVNDSFLVGASAGVMAIFIGIATYIPNYQIKLPLIGFVKLWILASIYVLSDLILIPNGNEGGHFSHLGGAIFAYIAIKNSSQSTIKIKNPFTDFFKRKSTLKTVHKSRKKKATTTSKKTNQQEIDAILDKISKSGYDSLSQQEKDLLFKQGKN